ncbi:ferrochelatase [Candidatus Liberibacter africanus]|uniref:Ferrochelatase n=1 Tax=Candidatus Liberibacter africanus PTSAPSY TaxID=1277257 RepID=A0A0G3I7M9_LIBAF|nr:ferrochelatase [Candidatus Liberibacter africanus]AKK19732.1 ferrochelatase [Candidatus Liberibacter africanus PTSAPSY]QTP63612.1 ferrochelatase [Candidatus Liberibacter africanus]
MKISSSAPQNHPKIKFGKIGILIVNLGTPDGYDFFSLRRYLREFLLDKRVIEISSWIWRPILFGYILNFRPHKIRHGYAKIWNTSKDESILRTHTRDQANDLAKRLKNIPHVIVDWAMRYGKPSINETINRLKKEGCDRLLIFPLYPQYSAATTATVQDKVFQKLMKMRWMPALRTTPPYYDDQSYISALANSVSEHFESLKWDPEMLLVSFHQMPVSYLVKGDPYGCHCYKTARLLKEALGWPDDRFKICFQSRFGKVKCLEPYTDKTVEELARNGVKRMAVITPGFSSDCLETSYEIAHEAEEIFINCGGEQFTQVPCLNSSNLGMDLLEKITRRELMGWI